jgi:outer membrane protein assembly factor BamA
VNALFSYLHMKSDADGKTLSPDNSDHLVRIGASLGWDTRDNWGAPHQGWLNELEVWQTGALGGDGSFWTGSLDVRRWQPLGRHQRILFTALTTLQSGTPEVDVPIYMDFHLGGANTIRGYDFAELGKTLYGKNQLLGTLEYSVTALPSRPIGIWKIRLRLGVELAAFADAGIAWSEGNRFAMKQSAGRDRRRPALHQPDHRDGPPRLRLEPRGRLPLPLRRVQGEEAARAAALAPP